MIFDEVRVTVIAAGFDRVEGSSSGSSSGSGSMPSNSASNDRGLGTSPTRITELFADSAEADPLDDDDDFDVPSFLK